MALLDHAVALGAAVIGMLIFITPAKSIAQGLPMTATIQFGNVGAGNSQADGAGNDVRGHPSAVSDDILIPSRVNISLDGTVTFMIVGSSRHQVEVYPEGTLPAEINTSTTVSISGCGGPNYVDDGVGEVLGQPPCNSGPSTVTKTFDTTGRFLVICRFKPHFDAGMWGWVVVDDPSGNAVGNGS